MSTFVLNPDEVRPASEAESTMRDISSGRLRTRKMADAVVEALPRRGRTFPLLTMGAAIGLLVSARALAFSLYMVNTTGDPGPPGTLSLRQAVMATSSEEDYIYFDPSIKGSTITLAQGEIAIDHSLQLCYACSNAQGVTISGSEANRIFAVSNAPFVSMAALKLTMGHSAGCGGAIYVKNSYVVLLGGEITASSANQGGAICAMGGANFALEQSSISGNTGAIQGGGVFAGAASDIYLYDSRVSGNTSKLGGGIYAGNADKLIVYGTTISGNTGQRAGGGLYTTGVGKFLLSYSSVTGNTVPAPASYSYLSEGGGLVVAGQPYTFVYTSTFAGNYAYASGAAIRIQDASSVNATRLERLTIAGNASGIGFGGVSASGGSLRLTSSIVANNGGGDLAATAVANYSLIKNPAGAQISGNYNLVGFDPALGPLGDHGGHTLSMVPRLDSPVINFGGVSLGGLDQRGYPIRAGYFDMGAVERQYPENVIFRNGFDSS